MTQRLIRPVIAGAAILVLALVFRDFVRQAIVNPLAQLMWMAGVFLDSLPQALIWIVLLLIVTLLAVGSLLARPPGRWRRAAPETFRRGQVEALARRIELARRSYYFRWHLAQRLHDLAIEAIAARRRLSYEEIRQQLHDGALDVPPDVGDYLRADMAMGSTPHRFDLRRLVRRPISTSPLDLPPEQIIQFIEAQMEVPLAANDR